jgi:flagellar motor switch protein FliM
VRLRIDMEDRGGNIELLLPYATIEPIRSVLLQMFMGEKFGRDPIWEGHSRPKWRRRRSVDAVLYEANMPLKQLMKLKSATPCRSNARRRAGVGALRQRHLDRGADGPGRRPRRHSRHQALRKPNTTFAMFEKADEQTKLMEAQ